MKQDKKLILFEYIVAQLFKWAEAEQIEEPNLSKLRLQKILFLLCTISATKDEHPLLEIFNSFYALPYGPVETNIYDAMLYDEFDHIKFIGNDCIISEQKVRDIETSHINNETKGIVIQAIEKLKEQDTNYLTIPVFDLVQITHRWTVWQNAMSIAEILGGKSQKMPTEKILKSQIKVFS